MISRKKLSVITYPLSILYGFVVSIRNFFYNSGIFSTKEYNLPIISVGNITVGGTGKTPHTEYLIKILQDNFKFTVLSRGYKRKSKGFVRADINSTSEQIGDEPLQIKQKFKKVDVVVCNSRVKGINRILKEDVEKEVDIILLDDAFQHRAVKPGISILLMDYNRPIYEDHMLPYGDLREKTFERYRANIVIVTKTPVNIKPIEKRLIEKNLNLFPYQSLYYSTIKHADPINIFNQEYHIDLTDEFEVVLITGIANPEQLIKHITKKTKINKHFEYPDHHTFTTKDYDNVIKYFKNIDNKKAIIITSEKDKMRILDYKNIETLKELPIFYIPIEVEFFDEDRDNFNNQILNYVRKNKRSDKIYKKQDKF